MHIPFLSLGSYQRIDPCPRLCRLFRNIIIFYGEALLAPRPTPKLEDYPLSAARDYLFIVFTVPSITGGRSSIRNVRTSHAVVRGSHVTRPGCILLPLNTPFWGYRERGQKSGICVCVTRERECVCVCVAGPFEPLY
jgi:hypothetical protein